VVGVRLGGHEPAGFVLIAVLGLAMLMVAMGLMFAGQCSRPQRMMKRMADQAVQSLAQ
jgi:hypothetical protein